MNRLLSLTLIVLFGLGIQGASAVSAPEQSSVTVCVDWATKELKYSKFWKKCPPKMTALEIGGGAEGPQGPQGPAGPAGQIGPVGPAGASGSSFSLSNYPVLFQLEQQIANATCEKKWGAIIGVLGSFNIETNSFGHPIGNYQWALDMADGCPYPYPEIFTEIHPGLMTNFTATTAEPVVPGTVAIRPYTPVNQWTADVTQMDVTFENLGDYRFCTSSDPQYAAFSMTQSTLWTQVSGATYRYQGPALTFRWFGNEPADTDRGALESETEPNVYFCGPNPDTSSGLGVKTLRWSFDLAPQGPTWASVKP